MGEKKAGVGTITTQHNKKTRHQQHQVFNTHSYDCNDLDTLREWVVLLWEMTINLQGMDKCGRKISDLLYQVNDEQGEANKLLKEHNRLLKERLTQYEVVS